MPQWRPPEATKADLERAAKMDDLGDIKIIRVAAQHGPQHGAAGQPAAVVRTRPDASVAGEDGRAPQPHGRRHAGPVAVRRADVSALHRSWPVERLFPRVLADMAQPTKRHLSGDQRTAWDEYGVQVRALGTHYTTATGDGAEFVPTFLHSQIYGGLKHYGPLGDDSLITVLRIGFGAKLDIPTADSLVKAVVVGAGTDGTLDQQDTDDVNYNPHKYHKQVGIVSELMLDDYVNFETWVNRSVSEAFGGAFNDDRTLGSGTSKMTGAFHGTSSATNSHQIAANTSIAEADVLALLALLDYSYQQLPSCRIMMHASTELDLMAQRDSSRRQPRLRPEPEHPPADPAARPAVRGQQRVRDGPQQQHEQTDRHRRLLPLRERLRRRDAGQLGVPVQVRRVPADLVLGGGRRADGRWRLPVDARQGLGRFSAGPKTGWRGTNEDDQEMVLETATNVGVERPWD